MNLEEVLDAAAAARPGYDIAAFKEAGLPAFVLTIRVLVQERKPLGAIDEGILNALDAGLHAPQDLSNFLGLPLNVLTPALARLNTSELINYILEAGDTEAKITLTTKGRAALTASASISPVEKLLKVCMDALTRKILFMHFNQLYKPKDLRERGWVEVPAASARRIEVDDIPLTDFDKVLNRGESKDTPRAELLSIRRIERRELHFLPCVMLFYRNRAKSDDIAVAFWREDGPSFDHERKFREADGPSMVGARLLGTEGAEGSKSTLEKVMEQVAHIGEEVTPAAAAAGENNAEIVPGTISSPTLQFIKCHEHPKMLRRGLLESKKRLLIISPWIRDGVVTREFVASLEALLKKGVSVHIGYGLDEGDGKPDPAKKAPITPRAEKDLKKLAGKYRNFQFVFVGNTHQKTLISDEDFAIVSSFNWLSFKGDSKGKPRDEHGVVIKKKAYIDQHYAAALALLRDGYSGQPPKQGPIAPNR